jgi:hypothetical protein
MTPPGVSDGGRGFRVEVDELRAAGERDLPEVAAGYRNAASKLACVTGVGSALSGSEPFNGTDALHAWLTLEDRVQRMLNGTATNLDLTAQSLCLAATAYSDAEGSAENSIQLLALALPDPMGPRSAPGGP